MTFPPIKPDRCLLVITLVPDDTAATRYDALRTVLKQCRLHPLDTTAASVIVIVEAAAFNAHLADVQQALGPGDMIHQITASGDRLSVRVIAPPDVMADPLPHRPAARRPPWLT